MHDNCGPIARYNSAATTDESTPPDSPQITRAIADLLAQPLDRFLGEFAQPPGAGAAANGGEKIGEDFRAPRRVRHFRMKLQAVDRQSAMLDRGDRASAGLGQRHEIAGDGRHLIAVAHPDFGFVGDPVEQIGVRHDPHMGPAIFAGRSAFDLPAQRLADQLHAVADAQHGNAQLENRRIAMRSAGFVNARRAARKNQAARGQLLHAGGRDVVPHDFAIDALLAHPPGDQLGVLRAEIEDQHLLVARPRAPGIGRRRNGSAVVSRKWWSDCGSWPTVCFSAGGLAKTAIRSIRRERAAPRLMNGQRRRSTPSCLGKWERITRKNRMRPKRALSVGRSPARALRRVAGRLCGVDYSGAWRSRRKIGLNCGVPVQILLTNDDGIYAPGLAAMERALRKLGDVAVVAPATEQSGVAHSITYLRPLTAKEVFDGRGGGVGPSMAARRIASKSACSSFARKRPDLVVSGINGGLNAGINVLYSGTVAAAIEGAFYRDHERRRFAGVRRAGGVRSGGGVGAASHSADSGNKGTAAAVVQPEHPDPRDPASRWA